jgi:GntR family transcriptional repressor for pyruvate dehydrogenase complex
MEKTLPDFIADELIARIYIGELKPGDRLPPERQLADILGVDRTSLRMALRTLNRMHLIRSVRGSGITVMDFRQHAGLDFLAAILDISELELGTDIKLESVDAFNSILSGLIHQLVSASFEANLVIEVRDLLLQQLGLLETQTLDDALLDQLAELHLRMQEVLLYGRGGLIVELMSNSSRPLRAAVIRELYGMIDVRSYVDFHQDLIMKIGSGALPVDQVAGYYHQHAARLSEPLKRYYRANMLPPRLRASPLQAAQTRHPLQSLNT